jgi:hypothetical protein
MGLWKRLKKAFFLGHVHWHEPFGFRTRLRKEFRSRLLLAGAIALFVFGVVAVQPIRLKGFLPWGLVFSAAAGGVVCIWPDLKVKSVGLMDDAVECRWTGFGFGYYVYYHQRFRYDTIVRAVIVPAEALGHRFSVLAIATPLTIQTLGIPRRTDPRKVGSFLASQGVEVSYCQEVPPRAMPPRPFPKWLTPAGAIAGAVLLLAGAIINPTRFFGNQDEAPLARPEGLPRPNFPAAREEAHALPPPGQATGSWLDLLAGGGASGPGQAPQQAAQPQPAPQAAPGAEGPPSSFPFRPRMPGRDAPGAGSPPGLPAGVFGGPMMPGGSVAQPTLPRGTATELIGGTGGMPYHAVGSGAPVLGFGYAMGSWAGEQALAALEPLYASDSTPGPQHVIARQGYAVGALEIDAPKYVSAVRVVFMRLGADGRLDPNDSYKSDWIGTPSATPTRTVGGDGKKVIGVQARRAAVLDALGLVVE